MITGTRSRLSLKCFCSEGWADVPPPPAHGASRGSGVLGNSPSLSEGVRKVTIAHGTERSLSLGFHVVSPSPALVLS